MSEKKKGLNWKLLAAMAVPLVATAIGEYKDFKESENLDERLDYLESRLAIVDKQNEEDSAE